MSSFSFHWPRAGAFKINLYHFTIHNDLCGLKKDATGQRQDVTKHSYCIHLPLKGGCTWCILQQVSLASAKMGNKIRKHRSLQLYRIFYDEVFWCPQFWASLSVSEAAMPRCSTAFARKGCAPANRNWITFKFINFEGLLWWNKHTKNWLKNWEPTLDALFEPIVELKIIFPKFPKANLGSLWGDIFNPHPEFLELCEVPWGWFPSPIPGSFCFFVFFRSPKFWEPILPGKTTSDDLMHQVASGNLKDILGSWTIRQRLHLHPDETSHEQFEFGNWTNLFGKVTWESSENRCNMHHLKWSNGTGR